MRSITWWMCAMLASFLSVGTQLAWADRDAGSTTIRTTIRRSSVIVGATVRLETRRSVGKVEEFVFNDSGCIEYVIVTYGNEYVAVPWSVARFDFEQRVLMVEISEERWKDVPTFTQFTELHERKFTQRNTEFFRSDTEERGRHDRDRVGPGKDDRERPGKDDRERPGKKPDPGTKPDPGKKPDPGIKPDPGKKPDPGAGPDERPSKPVKPAPEKPRPDPRPDGKPPAGKQPDKVERD